LTVLALNCVMWAAAEGGSWAQCWLCYRWTVLCGLQQREEVERSVDCVIAELCYGILRPAAARWTPSSATPVHYTQLIFHCFTMHFISCFLLRLCGLHFECTDRKKCCVSLCDDGDDNDNNNDNIIYNACKQADVVLSL